MTISLKMSETEHWCERNKIPNWHMWCVAFYSVFSMLLFAISRIWVFLFTWVSQTLGAYCFNVEMSFKSNYFEIGLEELSFYIQLVIIIILGEQMSWGLLKWETELLHPSPNNLSCNCLLPCVFPLCCWHVCPKKTHCSRVTDCPLWWARKPDT